MSNLWDDIRGRELMRGCSDSFGDYLDVLSKNAVLLPNPPLAAMVNVRVKSISTRTPTPTLEIYIRTRDRYRCRSCGSQQSLQNDYIFPVARGGRTIGINLRTLCALCNMRKGARI